MEDSKNTTAVEVTTTVAEETSNPPSKRRNLGRQARRRRKKMLEIEKAAEVASSTTTQHANQTKPSILPTDRNYVWPGVEQQRELTEPDQQALLGQLGYIPGNALSVGARVHTAIPELASENSPLVLKLYPLVLREESDSTKSRRKRKRQETDTNTLMEPFPTIYWVTHPRIKALISKLELQNLGNQFEKRLQQDSQAMASMELAHRQYGEERYNTITSKDWEWIRQRKWEAAFAKTRGVAGIRNYKGM